MKLPHQKLKRNNYFISYNEESILNLQLVYSLVESLRTTLKNSKPEYGDMVRTSKALSKEAEDILKATITSVKASF